MDWQRAFGAIRTALSVINSVGSTPGINLIPYVSTVANAASAIQTAMNVGLKVEPYVAAVIDTFRSGLPSASKLAALDSKIAELHAAIQAPLPTKEDGEPD